MTSLGNGEPTADELEQQRDAVPSADEDEPLAPDPERRVPSDPDLEDEWH